VIYIKDSLQGIVEELGAVILTGTHKIIIPEIPFVPGIHRYDGTGILIYPLGPRGCQINGFAADQFTLKMKILVQTRPVLFIFQPIPQKVISRKYLCSADDRLQIDLQGCFHLIGPVPNNLFLEIHFLFVMNQKEESIEKDSQNT